MHTNDYKYELNEKIAYGLLFFITIVSSIYAVFDISQQNFLSAIVSAMLVIVCLLSYYLIKYKHAYKNIVVFVTLLIFFLCIIEFFLNKGFFDENKVNFLLTGLLWSLIFVARTRLVLLSFYIVVVSCLFYIQHAYPHLITNLYVVQPLSEKVFDFVIYASIMVYLGFIIQKEYLREKNKAIAQQAKLEHQGQKIKEKKQEILAQREELSILYEQLEDKVVLRTAQLAVQNQQINSYANFNNSKIHQPLQQLTALSEHLFSLLLKNRLEDARDTLAQIQDLSNELDILTKEVNQILTTTQEPNT
jgi:hypothetical protein